MAGNSSALSLHDIGNLISDKPSAPAGKTDAVALVVTAWPRRATVEVGRDIAGLPKVH